MKSYCNEDWHGALYVSEKVSIADNRKRTKFTDHQVRTMEFVFNETPYITAEKAKSLSSNLDLNEKNIRIWFQNKRARRKILESSTTFNFDTDMNPIYINADYNYTSYNEVGNETVFQMANPNLHRQYFIKKKVDYLPMYSNEYYY